MQAAEVRTLLVALVLLALPAAVGAITEPETGTRYQDSVLVEVDGRPVPMRATGVALREKTILAVDVYVIVSYVDATADLGRDPAATLRTIDAAKRLEMDLRRGFGRDKLIDSFRDVIEDNYDDTGALAADMATFLGYFTRDARKGDRIVFQYRPGAGLETSLNGTVLGVIRNPAFAEALWTIWFGPRPADKGMRDDLVAAVDQGR